jgi:hypothetical protein
MLNIHEFGVRWTLVGAAAFGAAMGLAMTSPLEAAEKPELRTLFPHQAEIFVEGGGLSRLVLSPEILRQVRPDLSDLRLFDAQEREIPYLIDAGLPRDMRVEVTKTVAAQILEADRSLVERDEGPDRTLEVYEVAVPRAESGPEPGTGVWDLVFDSSSSSFVRGLGVEGLTEDRETVPLLSESSIFRLPNPLRERIRRTLPVLPPAVKTLRIRLVGEDGRYLDPSLRFESSHHHDPRALSQVPLRILSQSPGDRQTLLELERPRGLVADVLRLESATPSFRRKIVVWDEGPGSRDEALGEGVLFRVEASTRVEELEILLRRARGDRLLVVIEDGDSPPLEGLEVVALTRQPALIFTLPKGPVEGTAEAAAGTLRFGGGRAYRPEYDLGALAPSGSRIPEGTAAQVADLLADPRALGTARLGQVADNPHFDAAPILAFALRPGAALDLSKYRYRRLLQVEPSSEGLARLRLGLEDLSRARPDLADLRLVDGDGKQWAYLLERAGAREGRSLTVQGPETKQGVSRYELVLPAPTVEMTRLTLKLAEAFFDRAFVLEGRLGEQRFSLAEGRLERRLGDPRPFSLSLPAVRVDALALEIRDGDDGPLAIVGAEAHLVAADLYFAAPAGEYSLLLGEPEARSPNYELARIRDVVLAVDSGSVKSGELETNPEFSSLARLGRGQGAQRLLLWVALGLAVVVLAWLTLRLARREEG